MLIFDSYCKSSLLMQCLRRHGISGYMSKMVLPRHQHPTSFPGKTDLSNTPPMVTCGWLMLRVDDLYINRKSRIYSLGMKMWNQLRGKRVHNRWKLAHELDASLSKGWRGLAANTSEFWSAADPTELGSWLQQDKPKISRQSMTESLWCCPTQL